MAKNKVEITGIKTSNLVRISDDEMTKLFFEYSKDKTRKTMTPLNSTNDRIWVNKDGVVKYLQKKYLDEYKNNGWELGRKGYKPRKNFQGKLLK